MDETILKAAAVFNNNNGGQAVVADPAVTPPAEETGQATIAAEEPAPQVENTQAEPAVAEEAAPAATNEPYNYWAELEQKSEGLVKDEDSLKTIIERSKNYDTVLSEKAELEKNQWKPINDYVATFDKLIRDGASADQVKAFVKLNEYENLDSLVKDNAKEAIIAELVLTKGYNREIASKKVDRDFNFDQFDEDIPEQRDEADIMREELRITASNSVKALAEYRKDLSVVHNPEKESAEQAKLTEIANISTYNKTVEAEAGNIAKNFPSKLDYEFKIGEETVPFEDSIEKEFLEKQLPTLVADYFKDSLDPVNKETIGQAYSYAFGEYLKANDQQRLEKAFGKGYALGQEKTVNKYENRSGLPKAQENTVVAANEDGMIAFQKKLLGKS